MVRSMVMCSERMNEIAGLDNDGQTDEGGHCRTGHSRTKCRVDITGHDSVLNWFKSYLSSGAYLEGGRTGAPPLTRQRHNALSGKSLKLLPPDDRFYG